MTMPRPVRDPWRGTPLTVETANRLRPVEARMYAVVATYAATRTRVSLLTLGRVLDDRHVPLGANGARRTVSDLHDQGLLIVTGWTQAKADTPLAFHLAGMPAPPRMPRHLRAGEDRVKVGGRFTAPRTLDRDLLDDLVNTARLLADHQRVPADERDGRWIENLALYTEQRAAAFHAWSSIDASAVVKAEANRLTKAAQDIRVQAENRQRTEQRRANPT